MIPTLLNILSMIGLIVAAVVCCSIAYGISRK